MSAVLHSTQQYETGSPVALRDGTSGSRSAGAVYGFDTFTITPTVSVTYGARLARYDYLNNPNLLSPRAALNLSPTEHFRINAVVSRRAIAPGAEEFVPPVDAAIWLPPQRTFSSLAEDRALEAERTDHVAVGIERDILGPPCRSGPSISTSRSKSRRCSGLTCQAHRLRTWATTSWRASATWTRRAGPRDSGRRRPSACTAPSNIRSPGRTGSPATISPT